MIEQAVLNLFEGKYLNFTQKSYRWLKAIGLEFSGWPEYKFQRQRIIKLNQDKTKLYVVWLSFSSCRSTRRIKFKDVKKTVNKILK